MLHDTNNQMLPLMDLSKQFNNVTQETVLQKKVLWPLKYISLKILYTFLLVGFLMQNLIYMCFLTVVLVLHQCP